jgi:transposase
MSQIIAIGGDVSKGRVDVVILNQSGTALPGSGSYDDTHAGHVRLREHIRALEAAYPEAEIRVAVEATGGYERNWMKLFRDERKRGKHIDCWRLNPLALKKWLDCDLHRTITDQHAARGIAAFLLAHRPLEDDPEPTPYQTLYRLVRSTITDRAVLAQQLQLLLGQVHPELVSACRSGFPEWLFAVLSRYPTAAQVARAKPARLAEIPHVGAERAQTLIANASTSVASLTGAAAEISVTLLVERIRGADTIIERCSAQLIDALANDPRVALLDSITGIGPWTATCLLLEIGDIARFESCRAFIAWAGLDAHNDESGDGVIHRGISKRGNAYVRALLYMPTLSAKSCNPVIKAFYQRLLGRGKLPMQAIVAAMAKILRIAYSVLVTGKAFDSEYESKRAERNRARQNAATDQTIEPAPVVSDLTAPISRREANRRRERAHQKAAAPAAQYTGSVSQKATRADRTDSLHAEPRDASDQASTLPARGRHAGAIRPTKTASAGPQKGPKRCRPLAGRVGDGRLRRDHLPA